jgi:hypothetical protein
MRLDYEDNSCIDIPSACVLQTEHRKEFRESFGFGILGRAWLGDGTFQRGSSGEDGRLLD